MKGMIMFTRRLGMILPLAFCIGVLPIAETGTVSAAPTQAVDPQALRLPVGAFPPGASLVYDQVTDNATMDTSYFFNFHAQPYETEGRITGYDQVAAWSPGGADLALYVSTSVFNSPQAANGSFSGTSQVFATPEPNGPGKPLHACSSSIAQGFSCGESGPLTNVPPLTDFMYRHVTVGNCLAELAVRGHTSADFDAHEGEAGQALDTATGAAINVMKQAGCIATFKITEFGVLHLVKGKAKSTTSVKLKEKVEFVAIYTQSGGSDVPRATIEFSKNGKRLTVKYMEADKLSDGTTYVYLVTKFNKSAFLGTLKATVTLYSQGQPVSEMTAGFKVKK